MYHPSSLYYTFEVPRFCQFHEEESGEKEYSANLQQTHREISIDFAIFLLEAPLEKSLALK